MTKLKCDECGEKHDRMHVMVECANCYTKGICKELQRVLDAHLKNRDKSPEGEE